MRSTRTTWRSQAYLERQFRRTYTSFVRRLHRGMVTEEELFDVKPDGKLPQEMAAAIGSFSIWLFYLMVVILVEAARRYVFQAGAPAG